MNEAKVACPSCGGSFLVEQFIVDVPHFGEVLITRGECGDCGFKTSDLLPLSEARYPRKQKLVIESSVLSARVIRSPFCRIEIPEIGLSVEPVQGEAFITNVEGLLLRLLDKLKGFEAQGMNVREQIRRIEETLAGKNRLTLIFEDPRGLSLIGGAVDE